MKLQVNLLSQRDPRWASLLLGYNTDPQYSIGMYGCLITCLSMYTGSTPDAVNKLLVDNKGYVAGGGNFIWSKCTVLGLNETYSSPRYDGPVSPQGIQKIKDSLDAGLPLLCEIDFNPSTTQEEMHYVLLSGYDGDTLFACDPWTGQYINLDVYGGPKRAIIQFRAYDKVLPKDGSTDLQKDLDSCRIDRDNHWNDLVAIKDALIVVGDYSKTILLTRIQGLLDIERQQKDKDGLITDMQKKLADLGSQITALTQAHDDLVKSHQADQQTIQDQGNQIKSLSQSLQEAKSTVEQKQSGKDKFLMALADFVNSLRRK